MAFIQSMRWFGPRDIVPLAHIRQAGASGVVTALHQIPYGEVWPVEAIRERQAQVRAAGLEWVVVESVPVHEDIKRRSGRWREYIANYQQTLRNLAACGLRTVCYNFMPILDWCRTDVAWTLPNGARALRFEWRAFAAFDLFVLCRPGAEAVYSETQRAEAEAYYAGLDAAGRERLLDTILMGFPGTGDRRAYTPEGFLEVLATYRELDAAAIKENLKQFLREIVPVAEEHGLRLAIHPDDPPYSLLGLPRVVSTEADLAELFAAVDSPANGLTYCPGSLGLRADNDVVGLLERFASRVHFAHLRATHVEANGDFYETAHLEGDQDMYEVVKRLVLEMRRRREGGREDADIPMRPDHGHQILDDLEKKTYPGYWAIGRLKGLAELRGLELGIARSL